MTGRGLGKTVIFVEVLQGLRGTGDNPVRYALFHVRQAVKAFTAQNGVRDGLVFPHALESAGTDAKKVRQFLAGKPGFLFLLWGCLLVEDVIGDPVDFIDQFLVSRMVKSD